MGEKKKDIIAMVLLLTVTATVFFLLGMWSDALFGVPKRPATEIEYIPVSTSSSVVKTTVASSVNTTASTTVSTAAIATTSASQTEVTKTIEPSTTTVAENTSASEIVVQFPINLNTATKEELMAIKGIGETYAQRILDYREEIGGFDYLEQLMEIKGIGEGRFKAWSPYLTLE